MAAQWQTLPMEIKHIIFEVLLHQPHKRHQLSAYATVSKQWQIFFEKHIFHRLILHQSKITEFGRLFQRQRRDLLRHLWLRIELPKYNRNTSVKFETESEEDRNNQIVTEAVCQLLQILSSWGKQDTDLTLELSVHSPSDSKHHLPKYYPSGDIYPHLSKEDCTYQDFHAHMPRKKRRRRAQDNGRDGKERQRERIFYRSLEIDFETTNIPEHSQLLSAQVVKKLLIRRQYAFTLDQDSLFGIIESLPGLESISLEAEPVIMKGLGLGSELGHYLPSNQLLKTLSIFEDDQGPRCQRYVMRDLDPLSGASLAHDSCLLEHLSVSFAIDARAFFQDFWPGALPVPMVSLVERQRQSDQWKANNTNTGQSLCTAASKKWPRLKSLALTSVLLHPRSPKSMIDELLQAAANAAVEMPSLQVMEIWNHDQDLNVLCIFQYRRVGSSSCPIIHMSNTWGYRLPLAVVRSWSKVSTMQEGRDVRVSEQNLDPEELGSRSCGSIINHLELRNLVLQPISRCQLIWEAEIDNK
ncbi:hypothetical protein F4680DRAFT_463806 [Xylaria scruposa]|nr:hypothetical protein F4680DRAFT_463806 [Xylaria scruposa]